MKRQGEYRQVNEQDIKRISIRLAELQKAYRFFEEELCDRSKYYFYQKDGSVKCILLNVKRENFMHLCGLEYSQGGAKRFWRDLRRKHLVLTNLKVKIDGSTYQKLQVISLISELNQLNLKVTGSGNYLKLQYDRMIRTKRELMAIAFQYDTEGYIPLSLLKLGDAKFRRGPMYDVEAIIDCVDDQYTLVKGKKDASYWLAKWNKRTI